MQKDEAEDDSTREEIDVDELNDLYKELLKAYESDDFNRMEEIGEYLEGVKVSSDECEKVKKIVETISDFDYDEVPTLLSL